MPLIGMAEAASGSYRPADSLDLQGEELFLNGLEAPYRDRAIALIREQVAHVDCFHCRERLLRHLHGGPLRHLTRKWPSSRWVSA